MKTQRLLHFIVLIAILAGGVAAFYYASPNGGLQFIIGIITSVAYVLWGLIHHSMRKDLHKKIVVEYVLMGLIAVILLATILQR
jgi:hypothetical protein